MLTEEKSGKHFLKSFVEGFKMKQTFKFLILFGMLFLLASFSSAQTELPKANLPILSTSAGQSADVNTLNMIIVMCRLLTC